MLESTMSLLSSLLPDLLSPPAWFFVVALLVVSFRFFNVFSYPENPQVTFCTSKSSKESHRIIDVIQLCSILNEIYTPPMIWGRSGHIQTLVYGILGHSLLRRSFDKRHSVRLADATTVTFDVFERTKSHPSGKDYTLALCPGIGSSSESNYIRTCVHFAQEKGFRCVVLNHLGALADVPLTSNRIFSYGGTDELEAMMRRLVDIYPCTRFILVGFSMGANISTRLLISMQQDMRDRVIFGLSVGQCYCATTSAPMFNDWENGRRIYGYVITENMKRLLRRNYQQAMAPHVRSGLVNEQRVWATTSIATFDEQYSRRVSGFATIDDFYHWCSCLPLLSKLAVPMVFINAADDPIVPPALWLPVRTLVEDSLSDAAFVLTKHGGHLGFLEGTSIAPKSVTWLDRLICDLSNAAISVYDKNP